MAKHDYIKASQIVAAINRFYNQVAALFSFGTIIAGLLLPFFIKDDIPIYTIWLVVASVAGINLVTYMFLGKYRAILQADNRLYVSNYARSLGVVIQIFLGIVIIYLNWNIAFIKFIAVFTACVETVILIAYVRRVYPQLNYHVEPAIGAIKQRSDILVHQISGLVLNNTDILLLAIFGGTLSLASIYNVYNMILGLVTQVISSFLSARATVFARLYVLGDITQLKQRVFKFEGWYLMVVYSLHTAMAISIMPFIRLYTYGVKDANYDLPIVGLFFALLGISKVLRSCYSEIVASAGKFKETKGIVITSATINIILSLILIWDLKITGLLIGSIVAELYRTVHYIFYFQKNIYRSNVLAYSLRIIFNTITFAVLYIASHQYRLSAFTNYSIAFASMFATTIAIICIFMIIKYITDFLFDKTARH
ncbi:hypothetical protein [Butyrivibrio sp. INlla21]|uniref:hypothetical protein n=1 Tax=Butyrivibrio sp. INlla21 TaxID=1520811 RepID=UPI0011605D24|nr:hypothetical protein [Butyrivibrio sp. INlla21]